MFANNISICRNINWTAPEILINDSNQINELSDVWSLTMVIAEILTGEIPFDTAATRAMTVEKFVASIADGARPAFPTSTPEWMRTIVSEVPSPLSLPP